MGTQLKITKGKMMKKLFKASLVAVFSAVFAFCSFGAPVSAIVGGKDALQQYGAASIWYPDNQGVNRHRCTASVINQYWGLTSAHCSVILVPGQTQIRASSLDNTQPLSPSNPNGYEEVGLAAVYIHPDYTPSDTEPYKNDIALVRFQRPVHSKPLALSKGSPATGTIGKIASWGYICDDVPNPINCGLPHTKILQELSAKVASDSTCTFINDPQRQMCFVSTGNIDTMACNGDSGAPFVKKGFDNWVLMAVVEGDGDRYFFTPEHPNLPNGCTRDENGNNGKGQAVDVSQYIDWIIDTIYGIGGSSQLPQIVEK